MAIQGDMVHEASEKRRLPVATVEASIAARDIISVFTYLLVEIPGRKVCFEPILGIFVGIVVREVTLLLHLIIFVVSGVDDDRRVMADALDLRNTFGLD